MTPLMWTKFNPATGVKKTPHNATVYGICDMLGSVF